MKNSQIYETVKVINVFFLNKISHHLSIKVECL